MKIYDNYFSIPTIKAEEVLYKYGNEIIKKESFFKNNPCDWNSIKPALRQKNINEESNFKIEINNLGKNKKKLVFKNEIGEIFRIYDIKNNKEIHLLLYDVCWLTQSGKREYLGLYIIGSNRNVEYMFVSNFFQGKFTDLLSGVCKKNAHAQTKRENQKNTTSKHLIRNPEIQSLAKENLKKRLGVDNLKCVITGSPVNDVHHIKFFEECNEYEVITPYNLIPLAVHLHTLLHQGAIAFDTEGHLLISSNPIFVEHLKVYYPDLYKASLNGVIFDIDNHDHKRDVYLNWFLENKFQK